MMPKLNLRDPGAILVVSCYELGHQPLAAASMLAFLERAGYRPAVRDLALGPRERLDEPGLLCRAGLVVVCVPMHTAMRIGVRAARRVRELAPSAHLCFCGLYATLNSDYLLTNGLGDSVIGGEFEDSLVDLADALQDGRPVAEVEGVGVRGRPAAAVLQRLDFPVPSRRDLPPPERYAKLLANGESHIAAAVETTRGCLHHCRHCPITPVYAGRFFAVPRDVVLEDIRRLVRAGVRHITFADPDFLNGPGHARAIVRAMHEEHPGLTFDCTVKVEHVLEHREIFTELAACGCLFVVTAVESLSDEVLYHLDKGHTRSDVSDALEILHGSGIAMRPSLVAFTPWTRLEDYLDVLEWVEREGLVGHIDAVQFSIRLLVPPDSLLADLPEMRPHLGEPDREGFQIAWTHPDPRMDRLQREIAGLVERAAVAGESAGRTFERIRAAAVETSGASASLAPTRYPPARASAAPPRLTEPWFC